MQRKVKDNVHWLEFDLLAEFDNLKHGVFLRHGGYSSGSFATLNLSPRLHDEHVNQNLDKVRSIIGIENLVWSNQSHGIDIHEVSHQDDTPANADSLTTTQKGIGLMIHHADCQAAIIYDPVNHAVANVHAGWRGNVQNIYAKTISFMKDRYGSNPQDLIVCISPSLGPQAAEFVNFKQELPEEFWPFQVKPLYFDFWEISKMQLYQAGVLPQHIEITSICTFSNPQDYFSYRYNRDTGRHGTIIALV